MVWKALSQSVPVVDASTQVIAIHQNHRYDHLPEGYIKEVKSNEKLAGGIRQSRSIEDATHTLTAFESEIVVKPKRRVDMLLTSLRGAYPRGSLRMNCNAPLSSTMNPLLPWLLWFAVLNVPNRFATIWVCVERTLLGC